MNDIDLADSAQAAGQSPRKIRAVQLWLYGIAVLIALMVVVGGATRLTDSGLSITEWQLITGVIPPLNEVQWLTAFGKYKQIPEYELVNRGMSLTEFKVIYWWEWGHRFLGRFIGFAFFIPLAFFWIRGFLEPGLKPRLVLALLIGGLQGALGWYMVQSGLSERTDVSQYRLAAHLGLAVLLFSYVLWLAFNLRQWRPDPESNLGRAGAFATGLAALIFLQIIVGGFVAGLDAGHGYNTWPLMDGAYIPDGLMAMTPAWTNLFDNAMTVQFSHRMLAYVIIVAAVLYVVMLLRRSSEGVLAVSGALILLIVIVQVALGILTLLYQVPISLALCHQVGALVLLALVLHHLHMLLAAARSTIG